MKRLAIAALMLAALMGLIVPVAAQDALAVGTTTGSLAAGETVSYTLDATAGELYVISVISEDFDTYVNVIGPNDIPAVSDDDGGSSTNSLGVFVALDSGVHTVDISSFSSSASGDYTVTLATGATDVTVDAPLSVTVGDNAISVYRFEAVSGAYTIVANSDQTVDTSLLLANSVGVVTDEGDDQFGVDPALQRVVLEDGTYYIVLIPYNDEASGDVSLEITSTEAKILSAEPTSFTFNEASREDVATFDVEEGKTYLITVESVTGEAGDFSLYLSPEDDSIFSFGSFSFGPGSGGSFLYVADLTGTLEAAISGGFYSGDEQDEFTVTLVEQAE